MTLHLLIPVKHLSHAKRRPAPVLAEQLEAMVGALMEAPRAIFAIDTSRVVKMGSW